jgi:hypothetical protein
MDEDGEAVADAGGYASVNLSAEEAQPQVEVAVPSVDTTPAPARAAAGAAASAVTKQMPKSVAEPSAPPASPAQYRVQQCKRCGYYLWPTALRCPACGKWRRRAYAVLVGTLLLLALLGPLAVWWLPRFKIPGL